MSAEHDVPLTVGAGKPVTALQLLQELKQGFERYRYEQAIAERNERFLNGKQWVGVGSNHELVPMRVMPWEPMVTKNLLRPLWHTWASRVLKQGAMTRAYAHEATAGDIAKAFVANSILEYQRQLQDRDALNMLAALLAQAHGSIAFYAPWDPERGDYKALQPAWDDTIDAPVLMEDGQLAYEETQDKGDVRVELLTIFDYATDGSENPEDSKHLLVRSFLDKYDAMARLQEVGYPPEVNTTKRPTVGREQGQSDEVVDGHELYYRPCARFPKGLYVSFIGACVVEVKEEYPYKHGELPISVWKIQDKRGSPFGETHVNDAVPQQQRLNEVLSAIARQTDIMRQTRGVGKSALIDQWDTEPDGMIKWDGDGKDIFQYLSGPPIAKDLYELVALYERGIAECFGVSETVASGGSPDQTKSARQLAYMSELDGQKLAIAKGNLDKAMLRLDRQVLKNWQQFVTKPRLIRVLGEDRAADSEFFEGADIDGVDVWLEAAPATESSRAARGLDAEQAAAAGFLDVGAASERRDTGLLQTADQGFQRQEIEQLGEQAMQGQQVQANPAHDPSLAISTLRGFLERAVGTPGEMPLRALLQQYQELGAQMQAEPTQGQPQGKPKATDRQEPKPLGGLEQ